MNVSPAPPISRTPQIALTPSVLQHLTARTGAAWDSAGGHALSDRVRATDTLEFDPNLTCLGHSGRSGSPPEELHSRDRGVPECELRTLLNSATARSAMTDARHCDLLGEGRWR